MLGTSVVFGIAAGVVAFVLTLFASNRDRIPLGAAFTAGIVSAVIMLVVTWLVIGLLMPDFSFPLSKGLAGGWFFGILTLIFVSGFIACASAYASESNYEHGGSVVVGGLGAIVFVVVLIVGGITGFSQNPGFGTGSNEQHQAIWNLLNLKDAPKGQTGADLDINVALRVSPAIAKEKAQNAMPAKGSIGSYLAVGEPYLQGIKLNGATVAHPYYVCALTVTDTRAYGSAGNEVPGFIIVDATDKDAPAQWISLDSDHTIKYVQNNGQFFSPYDLDRYVYFNYNLPHQTKTVELEGMEVDDNLQPWYVATVEQPVAGLNAYYPTGILVINPHTGEIKEYPLGQTPDQVPDWIDRRMPVSVADQLVKEWAQYAKHQIVAWADTSLNKKKVDDESTIWSPDGVLLQYVLTSVGGDSTTTDLIYVNPRTFAATRYDMQTAIQSTVRKTMQDKAMQQFRLQMDVSILQIEWIDGKQVWYGVLEKDGRYWGVSLVQLSDAVAANTTGYIIDPDLQTAADALRVMIAKEEISSQSGPISNTANHVQVDGVIDRIGSNTVGADGYTWSGNFTLKTTVNGQQILMYCRYTATDPSFAYIHEGDSVTVTVLAVHTDRVVDLIALTDHTYQIQLATPSPAPSGASAPSASPSN
jgi:hypothetical protein